MLNNKVRQPWKWYRNVGKTVNFALIFCAQVPTLASQLKTKGFEEEDCDTVIADLKLESRVEHYKNKPNNKWTDERSKRVMPKYLACAEVFRQAFISAYPGLEERTTREFNFARKYGYVRTWHGPVRHLPELMLAQYSGNKPVGADMKFFSSMLSNLKNAAGNSPIQSLEAYHAFTTVHEVMQNIRDWGLNSRLINMVHDSLEIEIYQDELELVVALVDYCSSRPKPPYVGVPIVMDNEVVDFKKGDYYKHGSVELKRVDFFEELKKFNESHGTNLEFTCYAPL
jgi:DNA polymerase I-like protein with 3'-5' exonuclease and polymerase domains